MAYSRPSSESSDELTYITNLPRKTEWYQNTPGFSAKDEMLKRLEKLVKKNKWYTENSEDCLVPLESLNKWYAEKPEP